MLMPAPGLVPHLFRALRKAPLALCALASVAICAVPLAVGYRLEASDAAILIRLASIAVALGAAFVLDDSSSSTTQVAPIGRHRVRRLRIGMALLPLTATWVLAFVLCRMAVSGDERSAVSLVGLGVEAAALTSLSLAIASVALAMTAQSHGGVAAMPGLIVVVVALVILPQQVQPFATQGSDTWFATRLFWLVILVGSLGILGRSLAEDGPIRVSASRDRPGGTTAHQDHGSIGPGPDWARPRPQGAVQE